jgi:hypothetical protein
MSLVDRLTRRDFLKTAAASAVAASAGGMLAFGPGCSTGGTSTVFRIDSCPVHDGQLRHAGVDALLDLLAENSVPLFRTGSAHPWGGSSGIIAGDDIVLVKVNCQWKYRGATNTDVLRGLIHRILEHPDGFTGEVVIIENGQGQGSFDGKPRSWGNYETDPGAAGANVNAEDDTLTVDALVNTVFTGRPVSSFLLDRIRQSFISGVDHSIDGYRVLRAAGISYPCFTTAAGHRVELREGIWNGEGHENRVRLINLPVLKTHSGTGITGALKHAYGILSMADGNMLRRHYAESGSQCGKMYSLVRMPDLHIVDCIWVTYQKNQAGYPPETTNRSNVLLAGHDPVALDYYGARHIMLPLGGDRAWDHDPDSSSGLINHLSGAQMVINANGGIRGTPSRQGDGNITVVSRTV